MLGTAAYISPEQAAGLPAGPASDVYSFGVILFRMLTGRLPFVSTNAMELVRMHRDDQPPPSPTFRADAPRAARERLAAAALAKDPADRPADGAALLASCAARRRRDDRCRARRAPAAGGDATRRRCCGRPRPPTPAAARCRTAIAALVIVLLGGGAGVRPRADR